MTDPNPCQRTPELDLSLLAESLQMSAEQRALRHQSALNLMLEMERAGRELRERPESSVATTGR
jgi:hypothetical protein